MNANIFTDLLLRALETESGELNSIVAACFGTIARLNA